MTLSGCSPGGGSGETDTDGGTDTDASSRSGSWTGPPDTFTNTNDSRSSDSADADTTDPGTTDAASGTDSRGETTQTPGSTGNGSGSTGTSGDSESEGGSTGTGDPPDAGECCLEHLEPGCEVRSVQDCVCEVDPVCCNELWDAACTVEVMALGCGLCPGIGGEGDCCSDNGTPGCDDMAIENCVCLQDIACCLDSWDSICAQGVELYECGAC